MRAATLHPAQRRHDVAWHSSFVRPIARAEGAVRLLPRGRDGESPLTTPLHSLASVPARVDDVRDVAIALDDGGPLFAHSDLQRDANGSVVAGSDQRNQPAAAEAGGCPV